MVWSATPLKSSTVFGFGWLSPKMFKYRVTKSLGDMKNSPLFSMLAYYLKRERKDILVSKVYTHKINKLKSFTKTVASHHFKEKRKQSLPNLTFIPVVLNWGQLSLTVQPTNTNVPANCNLQELACSICNLPFWGGAL